MKENLPILLLKKLILLPNQEIRLEINNEVSKSALDDAQANNNNNILVISPINILEEKPNIDDLPKVGVIGKIKTKIKLPNGNYRIIIKGLNRVQIIKYYQNKEAILNSIVKRLYIRNDNDVREKALLKKLKELTNNYMLLNPESSNDITRDLDEINDLDLLSDIVVSFIPMESSKKLVYMNEFDYIKRTELLIKDINIELEIINLNSKIDAEIREKFENEQKNYILKEKINKLNQELGIESDRSTEINHYKSLLDDLVLNDKTKRKLLNEINRYEYTNENNPDASVIRNYLEWTLNFPWNNYSKEETNINKIKKSLDKTHFGLNDIKSRIIEYINIKKLNKNIPSPILCLVGPPGTGKTTIGYSISCSLNREFYKISVGGLNESSELNGHRRTYLGANPGKIIQGINKCETLNPVILIDEVDKMINDFKGDPSSVLLDILDETQNKMFVDNYIEEPVDLSKVLFILTANDKDKIPSALRDRLEIIELNSYTEYDKLDIAKNYLIPKNLNNYCIKNIKISDDDILLIIRNYTKESGVRDLERILKRLIRNKIIEDKDTKVINKEDIANILGNGKYTRNELDNHIGVVNSLAWTPYGGNIQKIETIKYSGNGNIIATGNIQDLLKESISVALSYIKSNNYSKINLDKIDLHINAINGSIKKEGTSGGIAITTSIISVINETIIPNDLAMTGEITLNGDILAVGGIKEKIIGAYNNNVKKVFIPKLNESDLPNVPKNILEKIDIILVKNYREVYEYIFKK